MPRVCPQCGEWCEEEPIDPGKPAVICTFCHYAEPFLQLPLFLLTGASGAGKSALSLHLPAQLSECVTLDTDILWGVLPATKEKEYRDYQDLWLHIAKNIAQNGRPLVLCGTTMPERVEPCLQRRYFATIHYLALVCDDRILVERLKQRPAWRKSGTPEALTQMVDFNRWLKEHAATTNPPMTLYDTTHRTVEQTIADAAAWIRERLPDLR